MDLSNKPELEYLGELIGAIHSAAPKAKWLLVGATARDLLIQYGHGIQVPRATEDVDLGVAVEDWNHFEVIRQRLLDSGFFIEVPDVLHQVTHQTKVRVDLVPFGGVERADGTIVWPPNGNPEMSVSGFTEALRTAENIRLPGQHEVAVVSLPMLIFLKLIACSERHDRRPGVDLSDALFILENYLDCGNRDRLFDAESDLLEDPNFDYELAGAIMAGRDLARLLTASDQRGYSAIEALQGIIQPQISTDSPGPMLQQLPAHHLEQSALSLESFLRGLSRVGRRSPIQ